MADGDDKNGGGKEAPPPNAGSSLTWALDQPSREARALFLSEWQVAAQPSDEAGHKMVEHSVTYGSTAVQAAYVLNGGALAILPPMMQGLPAAARALVPGMCLWFVAGIFFAAICSLSAYANFQWHAQMLWQDSNERTGNLLRAWYNVEPVKQPHTRAYWEKRITATLVIGVLAAIASFLAFIIGTLKFIGLAQFFPTH